MPKLKEEEKYMKLALKLARKARGKTSPNPLVGAIVVKERKIVGKGYHQKAGGLHAEINALAQAGKEAKGAELYLNLEPCVHYGRTPPCTQAIIKAGIKKVVVGMEDPNPLVLGKGLAELRRAGISVKLGILKTECEKLNEVFIKYITSKKPFVILKVASSLDGKIATRSGSSKWISGEESRKFVHQLRNEVDGIMVGIDTILKDDPSLTTRLNQGRDPLRIIVDSNLRIPLKARALTPPATKTIIATTPNAPQRKIKELEDLGAKVLIIPDKEGKVDLKKLVRKLGDMGITSLLIEGGSKINASALKEGIVDKLLFFYAPKIIGGKEAYGIVGGEGIEDIKEALKVKELKVRRIGEDLLVEGYL